MMGGTGFRDFVLANPTWMSNESIERLRNALRNINFSNECMYECWRKASNIVCKKYNVETIYDISNGDGIREAEVYAYTLIQMCNS